MGVRQEQVSQGQAGQVGRLRAPVECTKPRNWAQGVQGAAERSGPGSQASLPDHPAPCQALLHLLLLYGLVVTTALIWHPINKLAALLLLPYLAWLTVSASITYRLWRFSLCPEHQPQPEGEKSD